MGLVPAMFLKLNVMRKLFQLTGTLLLAAVTVPSSYAEKKSYEIPATKEEFQSQWAIIAGEDENNWEWVDAATPYAQVTPSNSVQEGTVKGATLVYSTPIEMTVGETYYMQANVCSADYNDDCRFYIVAGTDKENLTPIKSSSTFYVYRASGKTEPNFQIKPADSSVDRIFSPTETGTYYIGIRSWYSSGSFSAKKLQVQSLLVEKMVDYPQYATSFKAQRGEGEALEATLTWNWPTKTLSNAAISGDVGAKIYRGTTENKNELLDPANLIATIENGVAGEKGEFIDNAENSATPIPAPGKYYYYIVTFNENGENTEFYSSRIAELKWVGEDELPLNPLSASAEVDGDNVKIRFQNRIEGKNGGYINPEKFYNKIERKKDSGEFVTIQEKFVAEAEEDGYTTYIDEQLDGAGVYSYRIYAGYNENINTSSADIKNIFAGGAMDVPYEVVFSDGGTLDPFTKEGSGSWTVNSQGAYLSNGYSSNITGTVFTPPVRLEAGKTYIMSVESWTNNGSHPIKFYAANSPKTAGATEIGSETISGTSSSKQTLEAFFAPEENGNYYFGLSISPDGYNKYIYLDNLSINISVLAPDKVNDLNFVPAQDGTNKAAISFTVPSKSNAGIDLTNEISKVVVTRYTEESSEEIKVIDSDITPGMEVSFNDEVPEPGYYAYGVVSYIDDKVSKETKTAEKWLGYDVPGNVYNININADENNTPTITWGELSSYSATKHQGYIDWTNLKYRVYRIDAVVTDSEPVLVGEVSERSFTDTEIHQAPWSSYRYGIAVLNGTQEGTRSDSYTNFKGGVVDAECEHDLTNDKYIESFDGSGFNANNGINWQNRGETEGKEYTAYLPPFNYVANNTQGVKVTMTASRGNEEYEELLEVYLCKIDAEQPESGNDAPRKAATIAGKTNMTLVKTLSIQGTSQAPETHEVPVKIDNDGKYRLALRCASPNNKKMTVHTLSVVPSSDITTGIEEIEAADVNGDSTFFTLQGVQVKNPAPGIYIRISNGKATKVVVK